jgi:hypothetical protein
MSRRTTSAKTSPAVLYRAAERALLRPLTALDQMYAYYGSDRV